MRTIVEHSAKQANVTRQPPVTTTKQQQKQQHQAPPSAARRAAAATAAALGLAASPLPCLPLPPPAARRAAAATAAALVLAASPLSPALAASSASPEKVADFAASGILFRDAVEVTALEDPDVAGATVFVADFKRSLTAKLAKDFFSEPSQASISCAADPTAPLRVVNAAAVRAPGGTELFSERKGLSLVANKTLRVRRVFDPKRSALLYISYSTRLSDDADTASTRYRTSVCALPLPASAFGGGDGGGGAAEE